MATFFSDSWQCKHVVLACCHDAGFAPFLAQLVLNPSTIPKLSLLSNGECLPTIQHLGLPFVQTQDIFVNPDVKFPARTSTPTPAANSNTNDKQAPAVATNPFYKSYSLGSVLTNVSGLRIDRPLEVDPSVVREVQASRLCNKYHLVGKCGRCPKKVHDSREISESEFNALWWLARSHECIASRKLIACEDVKCIFGHKGGEDLI